MLLPFTERYTFSRKFEPAGNSVLHGAGQDPGVGNRYDPTPFHTYWQAMEAQQRPAIYMSYVPLKSDMPSYFQSLRQALAAYAPYSVMPQIGLYFNGEAEHGVGEPAYDTQVASGQYDDQIEALCHGLRELAIPVFLRIGFEFNGPWNGYQPASYIATWQRIVTALRAHNVDNVATVWCYCPLPSTREEPQYNRINRDYLAYYPGDEWVDWWSIDLFSPEMFGLDNTRWFLEDAAQRGFPVMIGESTPRWVGIEPTELAWEKWFAPYFSFIRAQPTIKAFCYINWAWDSYAEFQGWGDARIEVNPELLTRYQAELRQPWYQHAVLTHV